MNRFTESTRFRRLASLLPRPPWLILGGALALTMLLIATRPEEPPVNLPERAWTVEVIGVERAELRPTLELYGRLEAPQDAGLTTAVTAEVLSVPAQDGDTVTAGQLLLQMDDREARLTLLQREADVRDLDAQIRLEQRRASRNRESLLREQELLTLVQNDAERALNLQRDGVLSQANVDTVVESLKRQELAFNARELAIEESEIRVTQLAAQLMRAEALRDQARLDLERMQVLAPFDGVISGLAVSQGDRAQAGELLMRVHNPDNLRLRVQIPTRHAFSVRDALIGGIEMPAQVELENSFYPARLERVSGQIREGSGTVETFLALEAVPLGLSGVGATVRVVLSLPPEMDAIAVPAEAIYGRNRLFRVVDGRMQSLNVERVGERMLPDGRSEVLVRSSELATDDRIIVTKLSTAADGLLVQLPDRTGGLERPAALPAAEPRLVGGDAAELTR